MLFIAMTIASICFTCWPVSAYWRAKKQYLVLAINQDGIALTSIGSPRLTTVALTMGGIGGNSTTTSVVNTGSIYHAVTVPFWALFLLTLAPAGPAFLRKLRGVLRERQGHCSACGYDLTGNRSGVCPECGTRIVGQIMP